MKYVIDFQLNSPSNLFSALDKFIQFRNEVDGELISARNGCHSIFDIWVQEPNLRRTKG